MEISEIWLFLGMQIHQDFLIDYPDFFSGVIEVMNDLSYEDRVKLSNYLSDIQSQNLSNIELGKLWESSGSQIFMNGDSIELFYEKLANTVNDSLKS